MVMLLLESTGMSRLICQMARIMAIPESFSKNCDPDRLQGFAIVQRTPGAAGRTGGEGASQEKSRRRAGLEGGGTSVGGGAGGTRARSGSGRTAGRT